MRLILKITTTFLLVLGLQNIDAQSVMLTGAALVFPTDVGGFVVVDIGVEAKIGQFMSAKLSVGTNTQSGESLTIDRTIVSLEGRHFFKNPLWHKAPFLGLVAQFHSYDKGEGIYESSYVGWKETQYQKWGLGLIGGQRFQLYKRLGCELHGGFTTEIGDKTAILEYNGKGKQTAIDKNHIGARLFWGFNVYVALGKMNPEYLKRKKK
jgi:hypothetical protein